MTMVNPQELAGWRGRTVVGPDGDKVGKAFDVYADEQTGQPEWLAVSTGLLGTRVSFVPLKGAAGRGEDVAIPYDKAMVKDAPNAEADGALSQEEEATLYRHYGLPYSEARSDTGLPEGGAGGSGGGDATTRSEEEVRVGKASREAGRVRLRKWVETQPVTQTVPLAREEARIEREPITDANVDQALSGPEISEAEHEVVLREEEPVVEKRTVPKERVRLQKDVATEEAEVGAEVRKERVDVEGDAPRGRRGPA